MFGLVLRTWGWLLPAFICLLALCGCGGSSNPAPEIPEAAVQVQTPGDSTPSILELVPAKEGFEVNMLEDSFTFGGSGDAGLEVSHIDGEAYVTVLANAIGLRQCFLEVKYDETQWHAVDSEPGQWPGVSADQLLSLTVLEVPGIVYHGALVPHPDEAPGVDGNLTLLSVRFAAGPAPELHEALAVPDISGSETPDLTIDRATGEVQFSYYSIGDYNQDSLVSINDLTPIGLRYNERSPYFPEPFHATTANSMVDGNGDGLISINDLTQIGQNFGKRVTEWRVYGGDVADYPEDAGDNNGTAAQLGTIGFTDTTTLASLERLVFNKVVGTLPTFAGQAVWLRPVGDEDDEGSPSAWFAFDPSLDTTPPEWTYPDGVGIYGVVPLDGGARVLWAEATDRENSPVTYTVYYNEGDIIYLGTATTVDIVASTPPDPMVDQATEITGLTNGTEYAFAVGARDAVTPANLDGNTNVLTVTPGAEQEVPAAVSSPMTFNVPMRVSSGSTVVVTGGEPVTFLGDLTVEDGGAIAGQGDGLQLIVEGKLVVDGALSLDLPDDPLPEGDEDTGSLIVVAKCGFNFGTTSTVQSEGNIFLTDHESGLMTPEEVAEETTYDTDPMEWPVNMMLEPEDESESASVSTAAKTSSKTMYWPPGPRWTNGARGNWPPAPTPRPGVTRIVMSVSTTGDFHFADWNMRGPDAKAGQSVLSGCSPVGGRGKNNNWYLRARCSGVMNFNNVTITFGDGGKGGDAETDVCYPLGHATGGHGGKATNRFRFSARQGINVQGTFNLNPGNGGAGGSAEAYGNNGDDGAPPKIGGHAEALGGGGGDARWVVKARNVGMIAGINNITLGVTHGGAGGQAFAWAGHGGDSTDCANPEGAKGGYAKAIGGEGGKGTYIDGGTDTVGGGAFGGDGGDASAFAGDGGYAVDCCGAKGGDGANADATGGKGGVGVLINQFGNVRGGDGGDATAVGGTGGGGADCVKKKGGLGGIGGDATATGGEGGIGTGTTPNGTTGGADASGGDGGPGGDGIPQGVGGDGGTGTASGNPKSSETGAPGLKGAIPFAKLSHHRVVMAQIPDPNGGNDEDPLANGFFNLPMMDELGTDGQVGTVDYELGTTGANPFVHVNAAGVWGEPGEPYVLEMPPSSTIRILRENATYTNPEHDHPWIGVWIRWYANEVPPDGGLQAVLKRDGEAVCDPFNIPLISREWNDEAKDTIFFVTCEVDQWWDELVIIRTGVLGKVFIEWVAKIDP
jgi:hypothetical protein